MKDLVLEHIAVEDATAYKDQIRAALAQGMVRVTFTKADGTQRVLRGTTRLDQIPTADHPRGAGRANPDVQPVWDADARSWRSFRWDRVSSYERE